VTFWRDNHLVEEAALITGRYIEVRGRGAGSLKNYFSHFGSTLPNEKLDSEGRLRRPSAFDAPHGICYVLPDEDEKWVTRYSFDSLILTKPELRDQAKLEEVVQDTLKALQRLAEGDKNIVAVRLRK